MTPVTTPAPTFRVRSVLDTTCSVIKAHFGLLCLLAVVLHFVAWRFVGEFQSSLLNYADEMFRLNLAGLAGGQAPGWLEESEVAQRVFESLRNQGGVSGLAYFILLQVAVTTLTFSGTAEAQAGERSSLGSGHALIAARFRRAEFLFDVLRSIGILIVNLLVLAAGLAAFGVALFVFEMEYFHLLHSVPWIELILVLSVTLAFVLFTATITLRWVLATPITIVEDTGVLESLGRSWQHTAPCWKKLLGTVVVLAWLPVVLVQGVLQAVGGLDDVSSSALAANWVFTMLSSVLSAVVVSVVYYHLRQTGAAVTLETVGDPADKRD